MNLELPTHELIAYGKSEYALKLALPVNEKNYQL